MLRRARQCRLLRRREEAQRDPADGAAGAEALRARRDQFRPRHRRAARSWPTASTRCARPSARFLVITHYQRLLNYIVPDIVHVLSKGRIVQDRRQGAGARARSRGLRAISRTRRRERDMNADDPTRSRPRPRPRSRQLCRRRRRSCRAARGRGAARGRLPALRRRGPAAPPRRGVEIHRPARADARRQAARRRRPTPPPRRAPRTPARRSATSKAAASSSSTAPSRRSCPISPALEPGLTIRSLAQALAAGDAAGRRASRQGRRRPTTSRWRSTPRFMGDGAVIHVAAGAALDAAAPSRVRRRRRHAGRGLHRARWSWSRRARARCWSRATKAPAGSDYQVNTALELVVGDEAHVDHIKITGEGDERAACLDR